MTTITSDDSRDTLKMIRETLCVAQSSLATNEFIATRTQEHSQRLQRLIDDIDRQRPLGSDGKHGDLHTPGCQCEDQNHEKGGQ